MAVFEPNARFFKAFRRIERLVAGTMISKLSTVHGVNCTAATARFRRYFHQKLNIWTSFGLFRRKIAKYSRRTSPICAVTVTSNVALRT